MIKKLMICPYFGILPPWFDSYLANIEMLKPLGYDWHITTNLKLFKERVGDILGIKCAIVPGTGKVWDYRPAFGVLFAKELKRYDYWGHTDFDCVYGRVDRFVTDEFLGLATPRVESRRDPAVGPRGFFQRPMGPPTDEVMTGLLCQNCERQACTASEMNFAQYCCRACGQGQGHGEKCDQNHKPVVPLVLSPGDRLSLEIQSTIRQECGNAFAKVIKRQGQCFVVETIAGSGFTVDNQRYAARQYRAWEHPEGGRLVCGSLAPGDPESPGERPITFERPPEAVSPNKKPLDIHSNHHNYMCGPWSLYRNREYVNNLFLSHPEWRAHLAEPTSTAWIEKEFTRFVDWAAQQGMLTRKYTHWQEFNPGDTSNVGNFAGSLSLYDRKHGETRNEEIMMCHFRHTKEYPKGVKFV